MKTRIITRDQSQRTIGFFRLLLLFILSIALAPQARAGLAFTVDLYVSDGAYVFYTPLDTNDISPPAADGTYTIFSPGWPDSGSWRQLIYDDGVFDTDNGAENSYTDLPSALYQITNGTWTIQYSNSVTTNTYYFNVSLPGGLASNQLPVTLITSPADGATGLTNEPTFTWTGQPVNWPVSGSIYLLQYGTNSNFYYPDPNPVLTTQTTYTAGVPIPGEGPNASVYFGLDYVTNYTGTLFVATTPTNSSSQLAGWSYNSTLETGGQIGFTVGPPPPSSTNHVLVAHYTFDNDDTLGLDSSTNANTLYCNTSWGGGELPAFTTDAETGGGAAQFFGQGNLMPCYAEPAYDNWTNALSDSFTVSAWINTTTVVGSDDDELNDYNGQTIIDDNNVGNGVTPLGVTGTKAAFETALPPGAYGQDTLNSQNDVVIGAYVHVVVTRDAGSGLKQIYINGALDSANYAETGILNAGNSFTGIGGEIFAPYTGYLDDVQIYSGVLGPNDISTLYNNPGQTIPDGAELSLGAAVGDPALLWTTSGDTSWYVESTNTDNGAPYADESGSVTNEQSSTITVNVTGPCFLNFNWATQGNINDFDYEAYLDGDSYNGYLDDLYYDTGWVSDGPFAIPDGQHTVSWTAYADGDDDPTEAGFLDQVTFSPANPTLMNPQISNGNFQFSFVAPYGFNYNVLSTTNLATGNWTALYGVYGNGSTYVVSVPYNTAVQQFFAVVPQ